MRQMFKRLTGILFGLATALSLMAGVSLTVYADGPVGDCLTFTGDWRK